jgi:hypothetical protein
MSNSSLVEYEIADSAIPRVVRSPRYARLYLVASALFFAVMGSVSLYLAPSGSTDLASLAQSIFLFGLGALMILLALRVRDGARRLIVDSTGVRLEFSNGKVESHRWADPKFLLRGRCTRGPIDGPREPARWSVWSRAGLYQETWLPPGAFEELVATSREFGLRLTRHDLGWGSENFAITRGEAPDLRAGRPWSLRQRVAFPLIGGLGGVLGAVVILLLYPSWGVLSIGLAVGLVLVIGTLSYFGFRYEPRRVS